MRIISWNMAAGFGYDGARHQRAWEYLRELDPDVALLQEAVPPAWASDHWSIVAPPRYLPQQGHIPWGSAILAKGRPLTELDLETSPWLKELRGRVVLATVEGTEPLLVASIHSNAYPVLADRLAAVPSDGLRRCHDTEVWEIELIAMELERLGLDRRFIVGGDLNSALLFDATYGGQANAVLFSNLREGGFYDLRTSEQEQQTFFKAERGPYQLDHIYADAATAREPHTWRVVLEPARDLQLSDHAPLEVVLG